jgi:hypothetical protein
MHGRWFNAAVVMLWLATMSWLVTDKVLPQLLVGEPPSFRRIVDAQKRLPPVGWKISLDGRQLGWALTETAQQPTDLMDICSRVHFDSLPLEKLLPGWFPPLTRLLGNQKGRPRLDEWGLLVIDPLGHLLRFDSTVRLRPWNVIVTVRGTVEGRLMKLQVSMGDVSLPYEAKLPTNALLSDALSPQTQLPGLHAGQTWSVPVYNPLWPVKDPVEIVRATVEGKEQVVWKGATHNAWLVVYRGDGGSGLGGHKPKGMLWVRRDGAVLKQQATLFDCTLAFVRMTDQEAVDLTKAAGEGWWNIEGRPRKTKHD